MPVLNLTTSRHAAPIQSAAHAPQRQPLPFTGQDPKRNYQKMYRAAHEFHARNYPPRLDDDGGVNYWCNAADDMEAVSKQFGRDDFMDALLMAIYDELTREFYLIRDGDAGGA